MKKNQENLRIACAKEYHAVFSILPPKQDFREELSTYINQHGISLLAIENHDKVLYKFLHTGKDSVIIRYLHLPILFLPQTHLK